MNLNQDNTKSNDKLTQTEKKQKGYKNPKLKQTISLTLYTKKS